MVSGTVTEQSQWFGNFYNFHPLEGIFSTTLNYTKLKS